MRLDSDQKPSLGDVMTESEWTKQMWNHKVKPYLHPTPKSWIEETNTAENKHQLATEAKDAETEQSTAHNEELDENEPNAEAPLQGS